MTTETTPNTEPKAKRAPPRAAALAAASAQAAAAAAVVGGMRVMATRAGTYPNPGETYGRYRKPGDAFVLNDNEHFADEWMRELGADEVPVLDEPAPIPQTTGRHKPQATFAPVQ